MPLHVKAQSDHKSGKIDRVKPWIDVFQAIATIAAIVAALVWFLLQRSTKPQVKIEQTVTQRQVADNPEQWLIAIDVRATNVGKTKVTLEPGVMELTQVNPIPHKEKTLGQPYKLDGLSLEPGESDQALFKDFVIENSVKTIQIHSQYRVPGTSDSYWNLYSFVDIGITPLQKETATSVH
jgi:hypothetical protein